MVSLTYIYNVLKATCGCVWLQFMFLCFLGIEPWTFVQKLGDAVFIPAGCPYQIRNMKVNHFKFLSVFRVSSIDDTSPCLSKYNLIWCCVTEYDFM